MSSFVFDFIRSLFHSSLAVMTTSECGRWDCLDCLRARFLLLGVVVVFSCVSLPPLNRLNFLLDLYGFVAMIVLLLINFILESWRVFTYDK